MTAGARVFKTNRPSHTVWVEFPEGTPFATILAARDTFRAEFPGRYVNVFGSRIVYLLKVDA